MWWMYSMNKCSHHHRGDLFNVWLRGTQPVRLARTQACFESMQNLSLTPVCQKKEQRICWKMQQTCSGFADSASIASAMTIATFCGYLREAYPTDVTCEILYIKAIVQNHLICVVAARALFVWDWKCVPQQFFSCVCTVTFQATVFQNGLSNSKKLLEHSWEREPCLHRSNALWQLQLGSCSTTSVMLCRQAWNCSTESWFVTWRISTLLQGECIQCIDIHIVSVRFEWVNGGPLWRIELLSVWPSWRILQATEGSPSQGLLCNEWPRLFKPRN